MKAGKLRFTRLTLEWSRVGARHSTSLATTARRGGPAKPNTSSVPRTSCDDARPEAGCAWRWELGPARGRRTRTRKADARRAGLRPDGPGFERSLAADRFDRGGGPIQGVVQRSPLIDAAHVGGRDRERELGLRHGGRPGICVRSPTLLRNLDVLDESRWGLASGNFSTTIHHTRW